MMMGVSSILQNVELQELEWYSFGHEISENGIAPDAAKVECLLMMESPKSTNELMRFVQKLRYLSRSFYMLVEYVHPLQKATQNDPFVWTKYEQEAFENVKDKLSTLSIIMPPCWDDMLSLSLSVGEHAIGAVLMQKGKKQSYMRPIYYISKVRNDVEQTWHDVEQLVWTLVYATKRLKSYLIFKPFVVLTSCSLFPHALKYLGDNAKLQKWLLNLQLFDMSFIKEDSVRDNMADMFIFKEINVKNGMKKDLERKIVPSPAMHEELQEVEGTQNFDGAFKRSINKGAVGYVFFNKNGNEVWFGSQEVDVSSHNEAEYASLCVGLNECIKRHVKKLLIKGDSMLAIRQIQGPLPGTRNGKHYIFECCGLYDKVAKAKASRGATSKDVCNFIFDCICCKFGVPLELVGDQGKDFRNDLIEDLGQNLEIKQRYSTPYHPQCNGLVEAFNGVLQKILFKLVEEHPMDWGMYLERALWACRVTQKSATGFTPFHLVYDEECVMPINAMLPSLEFILKHNFIEEKQLKERVAFMHTLLLDRENAIKYYENISQKRADVFNSKIKVKEICKGMLVMRYNSALDTTFQTKFKARWEGPFVVHQVFNNGSCQLKDLDGKMHKARVNGIRLKPYVTRIM
ncbi:hypothetical protein L7F22_066055 [Adiantum nelumboides]|nr:hypothetical protein [Adiantum nelumboides]